MQDLIAAARSVSLPFEMSADGTYVRFTAEKGGAVYVVRNAWRGGYTVHVVSDDAKTQVGHFPDAQEAVAAAADVVVGRSPVGAIPFRSHTIRKLAS